MKKTLLMLLAVLLLACCIPGAAFATNETEATTTVSYTYEVAVEDEYIINIPSEYVITDGSYLEITASKMDISSDKRIYVQLDPAKNAMDGNIMNLISQSGNAIRCSVLTKNSLNPDPDTSPVSVVNTSYRVAYFNSNSLIPYQYGRVYLVPDLDPGTAPGTYTGTLHFDIVLEVK